jgi:glycosyltransferase involved in cell wall biosynthesis
MRVAHIIKATGLAGAEAHLLTLLPALRDLEVDSRLIVLVAPGRVPMAFLDGARAAGIEVEVVPIYFDADPTLAFRLAGLLRDYGPDVVHTHLIHADLHGGTAATLAGVGAVVATRHNDDRFRRLPVVKWLNGLAMRRLRRLITISNALADFAIRTEGAPPAKVTPIHYGLDADAYLTRACRGAFRAEMGWGDGTQVVLFAGRLTAQKGVDTLLAAWPKVAARCPSAQLALAGDGELRGRVVEALGTSREGASFAPTLLGWRSDVPTMMVDADLLVVPSRWEGFGLVTLEAMAASKPVVASRVSALPEIVVDGETGRLVLPGDPEALADVIIEVLADPARARQMGEQGRARLEQEFSVEKMAKRHAEVYAKVS